MYKAGFLTSQALTTQMQSIETAGAGCIQGDAWATQIIKPAYPISKHSTSLTGSLVSRLRLWVFEKKGFVFARNEPTNTDVLLPAIVSIGIPAITSYT